MSKKRTGLKRNTLRLHRDTVSDILKRFTLVDKVLMDGEAPATSARYWCAHPTKKRVHVSASSILRVIEQVTRSPNWAIHDEGDGCVSFSADWDWTKKVEEPAPQRIEIQHLSPKKFRRLAEMYYAQMIQCDFGNKFKAQTRLCAFYPASYVEDLLGVNLGGTRRYNAHNLKEDFAKKWHCPQFARIVEAFQRVKDMNKEHLLWKFFVTWLLGADEAVQHKAEYTRATWGLDHDSLLNCTEPDYWLMDGELVLRPPLDYLPGVQYDKAGRITQVSVNAAKDKFEKVKGKFVEHVN
jgi:hypothetical protein